MKIGILHISDLHIDKKTCKSVKTMVEKLIKDINKVKHENSVNINFICFTGDLIDRGDQATRGEHQIELAETHFIAPLLKALNIPENNFILVPGNHEISKENIAKMTEKGLASIKQTEEINDIIEDMQDEYKKRLAYFYDYITEKYIDDADVWNLGYSIEREVNNIKIGFVGLDSAWRSSGNGSEERGKLLIGSSQINYHYEKIKKTDIKICLMHHPLDWISDLEMHNVEEKLNQFDFVLRGHIHDMKDKQITTQQYRTIYNTAGKLSPISDFYSGYSIIDIDIDKMICDIYSREYFPSPRENFDKGLRINEDGKANYKLMMYNENEILRADLKLKLRSFFTDTSLKHEMFRTVDSFSPNKTNDFFVYPNLYEKPKGERIRIESDGKNEHARISFDDIIFGKENIMIFGKRDLGKTTILQQIGIRNASSSNYYIPVYIDLTETKSVKNRLPKMTHFFLVDNVSDDISLSKNQTQRMMENGEILYLLDNFDISDSNHIRWVKELINSYPHNRFIFAVEQTFYQENLCIDNPEIGIDFKPVYIDYFNKNQVRDMVRKWGKGKDNLDVNTMTKQIMTYCNNTLFSLSPFNIAVFMTIWDVDRSFIPINEGKVMEHYLEIVLDKLSVDNFQRSSYGFELKQDFLGYIAYEMLKKDRYYFTAEEFEEIVREYHEYKGFKKDQSNFDKLFFEKNILYKWRNNVYFINTAILEYCIAFYATKENTLYDKLTIKSKRKYVVRELIYYSGLVADCSKLLNLLREEINETIENNFNIVDAIEKINIGIEFQNDSETIKKAITHNRKSMEEIDALQEPYCREEIEPMKITKFNTPEEKESFFDLLTIYGGVIKNAETISKDLKKLHLETYMLGINFQFGIIVKNFSHYLLSTKKEELPDDVKESIPEMTDSQFEKIKLDIIEMIKVILPIGLQFFIDTNIGTPKLEVVINELIEENIGKKFTRFMLIFLYCDLSSGYFKELLKKYIKEEESKDILKLILFKLTFYYRSRYFGVDTKIDEYLLDLITDVIMKTNNANELKHKMNKSIIKREIKTDLDREKHYIN